MGHLPIVNQDTIISTIKKGHISIKGKIKEKVIEVISSMFADVLAVRKGDLIFPWIIKSKGRANIGFKYVFKVSGSPIFVEGDEFPIKIPLEKEGVEFENPLSEIEALDLWRKKLLWNAIGKKSLGRGKSFTHQLPMEDELMLYLLNSKNNNKYKKIKLGNVSFPNGAIHIDLNQDKWGVKLKEEVDSASPEDKISKLRINGMPWRNGKYFRTEKTLEAWLMENIDKNICKKLNDLILLDGEIEWFGSYLPFGVQGGNIDIVMIQSKENKKFVTIIELKVSSLNSKGFKGAANQSIDYSLFLKDAFDAFEIEIELNPIVLSGLPKRKVNISESKITRKGLSPIWISYFINEKGEIEFLKNM